MSEANLTSRIVESPASAIHCLKDIPLDLVRGLFPPEKYGWGEVLKRQLCLDFTHGLKVRLPTNGFGRYDCARGSARLQQVLESWGYSHARVMKGQDCEQVFAYHYWIDLEGLVIDVTPLYHLAGAVHSADESISAEHILKQTHLYIPAPVPLSFTQEGTTQYVAMLGDWTSRLAWHQFATQETSAQGFSYVELMYILCKCEKGRPQQKYYLSISIDVEKAQKTMFIPAKAEGIHALEALASKSLIHMSELSSAINPEAASNWQYELRAQQDWDVVGAFTLNVVHLLRREYKKKARESSRFQF